MTDDEKWLFAYEMLKDFHAGMVVPTKKFIYDNIKGNCEIPIQQRRYVKAINGQELPPNSGVLFLDEGFYRGPDGEWHKQNIKCGDNGCTPTKLIWAIVRNTLLLQKLSGVFVRESAVWTTIHWYLRYISKCPLDLVQQLSEVCTWIALLLIDEHSDKTPEELKAVTPKLRFKNARVVNRKMRCEFKEQLVLKGIADMRFREEQTGLVDTLLKNSQFQTLDKPAFKNGILKWLRKKEWLKPLHGGNESRAELIKHKRETGERLDKGEYNFIKRHPELFQNQAVTKVLH